MLLFLRDQPPERPQPIRAKLEAVSLRPRKPEVMSPAGYWPQLHAAVEAGADAVYFGLKHFTARAKAGFSLEELPEAMRTLHRRGVRGFVTFNTLVFDHELRSAARALAAIAEAGADAIIVQDVGVLALAREVAPDLEIHASTQMSVTDADGARLAAELGARRVTLARELSLPQIEAIARETPVELEVFVHGALCVAYSGQCFSSEAWGGRSANRGQCAQACRLPYEMIVDGAVRPLGDARYLLSPGDLYALRETPELVAAGVAALKIEGRYKDADYVAAATSAYRKAVDETWAGRPLSVTPAEELELEQIYSRGLGPYFLSGTNHQKVVDGRAPRHRGVRMGRVVRVSADAVTIEPSEAHAISALKAGDGIVFDAAGWRSPQEPEEGGRVYSAGAIASGLLELRFGRDSIRPERIRPGDLVWRTDDPVLARKLRVYTQPASPVRKQTLAVEVTAVVGKPLETVWRLGEIFVRADSDQPLAAAQNQPATLDGVRQQMERLGDTPYELGSLEFRPEGGPFLPASLLNRIRRDAVKRLAEFQSRPRASAVHDPEQAADRVIARAVAARTATPATLPALHVLVRTPEQLDAAIELRPTSVTLDYLDLYGLKPSVDRVKEAGLAIRVASPRILKPGEERIADFLLRLRCPILVRPAGLLHALQGKADVELVGDFSLNAANAAGAGAMLAMGLARITPTHDLNGAQIATLARQVDPGRIEAVAYQHLPVFHTEHCVFCRFLSTGTSYLDCGRPCERHRVELRDSGGRAHPVLADVGCRNTVFGAEAQEASLHLERWLASGIRHFRLEFAHETPEQVTRISRAFGAALAREITFAKLHEDLQRLTPQGSTEGSLFTAPGYLALPVLQ